MKTIEEKLGEPVCNISTETLGWNAVSLAYVNGVPSCNLSQDTKDWNDACLKYTFK